MEPISAISLVSSCASLTRICISVSKSLTELAEKYKHAELSMLSLAEECNTVQLAWTEIERWAAENQNHIDGHHEIQERLHTSVRTGRLVVSSLEMDLKALQKAENDGPRFFGKSRLVWNDNVLRDHQHRLRGQVAALTLLLEVIQLYVNSPLLLESWIAQSLKTVQSQPGGIPVHKGICIQGGRRQRTRNSPIPAVADIQPKKKESGQLQKYGASLRAALLRERPLFVVCL
jgi:hypothetical protein